MCSSSTLALTPARPRLSPRFLTKAVVLAALTVTACGGAPPPAPEPPRTEAPSADGAGPKKAGARDDKAEKAAALEALVAQESAKGTCDEGHKAALEKLLEGIEAGMKDKAGEDGKPLGLQVVGKRVIPLGTSAKSMEMAVSGKGTEVHVLAFGVRDVSLDVLVGNAAATTLRSPFQRTATTSPPAIELAKAGVVEVQSDSRQVSIKPGQPIVVKLGGQGCAALISFLKP